MDILVRPIITEKMTELSEDRNQYGFVVLQDANKVEIKKAVEEAYGVNVKSVNTMIYAGKSKARYPRAGVIKGRTSNYKKAVVTVAEGDMIDFYSNI